MDAFCDTFTGPVLMDTESSDPTVLNCMHDQLEDWFRFCVFTPYYPHGGASLSLTPSHGSAVANTDKNVFTLHV